MMLGRSPSTLFSRCCAIVGFLLLLSCAPDCAAYSVLTHEAIIDAAWKDSIQPVLLSRFPSATESELLQAHAYAYGGAIIQDMGYYPFGNRFFSDLTHYMRSGDFVLALIEESTTLNEYAFALGALSHYAADNWGHELATNRAVAILYPGLAVRYGPVVAYEAKPSAHMKVEYGFDVDQVAEGNYAPKAYHDFVGFEVSKPVLERAFARTYSLEMSSIFFSLDLAIGSYRHAASSVIPSMTKVAWHLKRDEIENSHPSETKKQFIYHMSRSGYRKEWGNIYEKPGFGAQIKAFFLRIVPKIGPFSGLAFHPPTPAVEQLYMSSVNDTLEHYRALLLAQKEGRLKLPNENLDTGSITTAATYRLTDETYAKLLDKTSGKPVSDALRYDLLSYYADLEKPFATKKNSKAWRKLVDELNTLKSMPVARVSSQCALGGAVISGELPKDHASGPCGDLQSSVLDAVRLKTHGSGIMNFSPARTSKKAANNEALGTFIDFFDDDVLRQFNTADGFDLDGYARSVYVSMTMRYGDDREPISARSRCFITSA